MNITLIHYLFQKHMADKALIKLIKAAEIAAYEKGYEKIALLVNLENKRAFSLYKKLGYQEDKTVMLVGEPYVHLVKPLYKKAFVS